MKPSRFTEEQIIGILREQEAGTARLRTPSRKPTQTAAAEGGEGPRKTSYKTKLPVALLAAVGRLSSPYTLRDVLTRNPQSRLSPVRVPRPERRAE